MSKTISPPKWILFLLWPFRGEPCYPQIEGDLNEEFAVRYAESGLKAARRWYLQEACRSALALVFRRETVLIFLVTMSCAIGFTFVCIEARLWLTSQLGRNHGWEITTTNFILWTLLSSASGTVASLIMKGHERMIRLVFSLYYLAYLVLINMGMALNIWRGFQVNLYAYLKFAIYISWIPIWSLLSMWAVTVWIERNRRSHEAT